MTRNMKAREAEGGEETMTTPESVTCLDCGAIANWYASCAPGIAKAIGESVEFYECGQCGSRFMWMKTVGLRRVTTEWVITSK
jgi:hypothetical protein